MASAPSFELLMGASPPPGFVVNSLRISSAGVDCSTCGKRTDAVYAGRLIIAERYLIEEHANLCLFVLPDEHLLASLELVDRLEARGDGVVAEPVWVDETEAPSERFFLLRSSLVVTHDALCSACGRRQGEYTVPNGPGVALCSRTPFARTSLLVASVVLEDLKTRGLEGAWSLGTVKTSSDASFRPADVPAPMPSVPDVGTRDFVAQMQRGVMTCKRRGGGDEARAFDVQAVTRPGCTAAQWSEVVRRHPVVAPLEELYRGTDGMLLFSDGADPAAPFPTREAIQASQGAIDDPSQVHIAPLSDWPALRDTLGEIAQMNPFPTDMDLVPFARLTGSPDCLCLSTRGVYYVSFGNRGHAERIADSVPELFGMLVHAPADLLMRTASVATFYDGHAQWYPVSFRSTAPTPSASLR